MLRCEDFSCSESISDDCGNKPCGSDYDVDCLPDCDPDENGRWICNPIED